MSETKLKILQSAIEVWGGNINAPLDDIANYINISRRTLHRHYAGRDDLINSVFNHIITEYLIQTKSIIKSAKSNEDKLQSFLYFDINSGSRYMIFCELRKSDYKEIESQNTNFKELYSLYIGLFKELKNEQKINDHLSIEWIEIFYSTIIESTLKAIESGLNKEECLNMAWSSFWQGINK